MRRGEGILRVLRKHIHNKLSPHTMPNWVRRDLIVLVVVLAVRTEANLKSNDNTLKTSAVI